MTCLCIFLASQSLSWPFIHTYLTVRETQRHQSFNPSTGLSHYTSARSSRSSRQLRGLNPSAGLFAVARLQRCALVQSPHPESQSLSWPFAVALITGTDISCTAKSQSLIWPLGVAPQSRSSRRQGYEYPRKSQSRIRPFAGATNWNNPFNVGAGSQSLSWPFAVALRSFTFWEACGYSNLRCLNPAFGPFDSSLHGNSKCQKARNPRREPGASAGNLRLERIGTRAISQVFYSKHHQATNTARWSPRQQ